MSKRKFYMYSFFTAMSLVTAAVTTAVLSYDSSVQNAKINTTSNNNTTSNLANTKDTKSVAESRTYSFTPISPIINHPQQILTSNSSLLPTFSIGSTDFGFRLNQSSSAPAISFAGSSFNLPFKTTSPSSSVPLNQSSNGINTGNVFIGCQIYNRTDGTLVNENNYGSVLNQSYSNPDGKQIIVENQFSSIDDVIVNPSQIGIFSIQNSAGVKAELGASALGIWKMHPPVNASLNNWEIDQNDDYVDSTLFKYNLIIQNDGTNYHFYAPTASSSVEVSYNGATGDDVGVSVDGFSATQYVNYLLANRNEQLKFKLRAENSLVSALDYRLIFRPDDANGIVKVDVQAPFSIVSDGMVYEIESAKLFEDVLTLTGFNIDSNKIDLNPMTVINPNDVFDDGTKQNSLTFTGIDGVNKSFNIVSRYTQVFKLNLVNGNFANPRTSILDWPTYHNLPSPLDSTNPYKLINFPDISNSNVYPLLNSKIYGNNLWADGNAIPSISKYRTRTVSQAEAKYCVDARQLATTTDQQWFTIETAQLGSQHIYDSVFRTLSYEQNNNSSDGVVSGTTFNIPLPIKTSDNLEGEEVERWYATLVKSNNYIQKLANDPVAINIKVRNDYHVNDPSNNEGMFGFDTGIGENSSADFSKIGSMDGRYGSQIVTSSNQSTIRFQYLSGIVTNYGSNIYWMAPTAEHTSIVCDEQTLLDKTQIGQYVATDFLRNNLYGQKLNIKINGGIVNTLSQMTIEAYPNDVGGWIEFVITPGVGINSNIKGDSTDTKEYGFLNLEPIRLKVTGFKKTNFVNDTQVISTTFNMSSSLSDFTNAYITAVVNNYLKSSQSVSSDLLNKRYDILADVINTNFKNVYNINTNSLINTHNGNSISAELRNQVSNINITIPSRDEYLDGGYNHLNLSFDLKGIAEGNVILSNSKHYEVKLLFKLPEKVATIINPKLLLSVDDDTVNEDEKITAPQIKSILDNQSTAMKLISLMLTGYKDITMIGEEVEDAAFIDVGQTANFEVPFKKYENGNLISEYRNIPVVRRELAYGYPSDFFEYYLNTAKSVDDELLPQNSWVIKDVSLNESNNLNSNQSVNLTIGLKYFVTSNGIISYDENGKDFNLELVGRNEDNRTTTLMQVNFSSPSNQILASELKNEMENGGENWNTLRQNILDSIAYLPDIDAANSIENISYIPDSIQFNNIDGILTFNVGLRFAKINGIDYDASNNNNRLYDLGTVTINNFKRGVVTILVPRFTATVPIDNIFGESVYPSEISPTDFIEIYGYDKFVEIIRKQAFIDLPSTAGVRINDGDSNWFNGIKFDNINGQIIINPVNENGQHDNLAKIFVTGYRDENSLVSNVERNFAENQTVVIDGFKKTPPTELTQNNYLVNSSESILTFDQAKSKDIVYSLLSSIPDGFNKLNDIVLDNFIKHASVNDVNNNNVRITFDVYVKYYYDINGILVDRRSDNQLISFLNLGSFTISGFKATNVNTVANESLHMTITDFAPYIGSNYVNFHAGSVQDGYEIIDTRVENKIKQTIINSIQTSSPFIVNAPEDLQLDDIIIKVRSSDNTEGNLLVYVYLKKYYLNGNLQTNPNGYIVGLLNVGGFKVLPKQATSLNSDSFIVTGSYAEEDANLISADKAAEIVSINAPSIFLHLPSMLGPSSSNSNDNPFFNTTGNPPFNVIVKNLGTDEGSFHFDLSLNSYYAYTDDVSHGNVVWINGPEKSFGRFTVNGVKGWQNTSVSSRLDLSQYNSSGQYNDIMQMIPTDVSTNASVMERIKQLIYENGIAYWNQEAQPWTNYLIIDSTSANNAIGELSIDLSITSYIDNGLSITNTQKPLSATIVISGFKSAQPTTVNSVIRVSNPYDSMYPYELTDEDAIKNIIYENINNRPNVLTIDDIAWSSIDYDNFSGEITIKNLRLLRNYYDDNSNLGTSPQPYGNIRLTNFLSAGGPTEIRNEYNINNNNFLPFQFWKRPSFEFETKQLIIDELISNPVPNLSQQDIKITNIRDDNISGSLYLTVELAKYFDESGRLIQAGENTDNYKKADIVLNGFKTTVSTKFSDSLSVTNFISEETTANQFLNQPDALTELKNWVMNYCFIGKWQGYDENDINISEVSSNNLDGEISVTISVNAWIDDSGSYRDDELVQKISFTGFKQVQVTYISSELASYNGTNIAQTLTDSEIKNIILNQLVRNKPSSMTIDNIELLTHTKQFNNATGRLSIKAKMTGNYWNENGELVESGSSKTYDVNISLIKNASPTSVISEFDISNVIDMAGFESYEFLTQKKSDGEIDYDQIKSVIFENLFNLNDSSKMVLLNYPTGFADSNYNLSLSDININPVQIENGMELLATPQNGSMILTVSLNKYYDASTARLVIVGSDEDVNALPKTFEILVTGFQEVNGGTTVPTEININDYSDGHDYSQDVASNYTSTSTTSPVATAILESIENWPDKNSNNIVITNVVADNTIGAITVTFRIKGFKNENGVVFDNWSNDYTILVNGFRPVTPTLLNNINIYVNGQIGSELANILNADNNFDILASENFSNLNLAQIYQNKYFETFIANTLFLYVRDNLSDLIINPTPDVNAFFEGSFTYSEFARYFQIKYTSIDNLNGNVTFNLNLLHYYSSLDGLIVENSNPLSCFVTITGFYKPQVTKIKSSVRSDSLSDIVASDWTTSSGKESLKKFIFNNKSLFIENPAYNFVFSDIIGVDDVIANNLIGELSFKLTIDNYFGSDGLYHNNESGNVLSKVVSLRGFKFVGATTMSQLIDVSQNNIFGVNSIEELSPLIIRNALFQFRNGSAGIEPIFNNLPDRFSETNINVYDSQYWTIDYKNGSLVVPVELSRYNNANGQLTTTEPKQYALSIVGFDRVSSQTVVNDHVDIGFINELAQSLVGDINKETIRFLLTNNSGLLSGLGEYIGIFNVLPKTFEPFTDIRNLEITDRNAVGSNNSSAYIVINFEYRNVFAQNSSGDLFIDETWRTASVTLTGFKQLQDTRISGENNTNKIVWDLSDTAARSMYVGELTNYDLANFANERSIKEKYIINPAEDAAGQIITNVVIDEILYRNGIDGSVVANVKFENFVKNSEIIQGPALDEEITFIGFNLHNETVATSKIVQTNINEIPSIYLRSSNNLVSKLNEQIYLNNILGDTSLVIGDQRTEIVDVLGIDGTPFDQGGQIEIDDKEGSIKCKLMVKNTYNADGSITYNPVVLKNKNGSDAIIEVKTNTVLTLSSLKEPTINLSSSDFANPPTSADIFSPSSNQIKNVLIQNIDDYMNLGMIVSGDGTIKQEMTEQKIQIDISTRDFSSKDGRVWYSGITFTEWWTLQKNSDLRKQQNANFNNSFTDDSMVFTTNSTLSNVQLGIVGFQKNNPQEQQMIIYLLIGLTAGAMLILIIVLFAWLFKRRFRNG